MLTLFGKPHRNGGFCDGVSRRDFLSIGGSFLGGLSLNQVLAAESVPGSSSSHRSIINVFLPGGPPHQDMWDIKTEAPSEMRGEFKPISTNVPGIQIGENFPCMAAMMDKFVVIRSISGASGSHDAYQCMTGKKKNPQQAGEWPSMGAWLSKVMGSTNPAIPANLSLTYPTGHKPWGFQGEAGFLGLAHAPFRLVRSKDKKATALKADSMVLQGVTLNQLDDRVKLLRAFDSIDRSLDHTGTMDGIDGFTQQALGILTSSQLVDALDMSKEDPKILARYGEDDPKFMADGAPRMVRNLCVARRLVEAGARIVTLNFSRWDWHGGAFKRGRDDMPRLDRAVSALVSDLHERGLDKDVSVVVWGEFGRTPKVNNKAGRDHWPKVSTALLAGGGMRTGQVIGATNKKGEYAAKRPVTHEEVFATLYHNIGLSKMDFRIFDPNGRPQYPVDPEVKPMREVV